MEKTIRHIGFVFVALRILYIRIRAQVEPPVQYKTNCVENSESIQGIFRSGCIDLLTKYFGDEKSSSSSHLIENAALFIGQRKFWRAFTDDLLSELGIDNSNPK